MSGSGIGVRPQRIGKVLLQKLRSGCALHLLEGMWRSATIAAAFAASIVSGIAGSASQESVVTGISLRPEQAQAGSAVNATAAGSGLCGAVHIDWGDGIAITYPTSTLPVAQSHVYKYGGTYTVRAQGMGNCAGQATTTIKVAGPPPPAPPAPAPPSAPPKPTEARQAAISTIDITRPEGAPVSARSIRVNGTGRCAYTLNYGDGNTEGRNADLPDVVRHNYPADGRYTIVATASAPCGGTAQAPLVIGRDDFPVRRELRRMTIAPREAGVGDQIDIRLDGSGSCRVTVDFGDDRQRELDVVLPYRLTHRFTNRGNYEVIAWADAPCSGGASGEVRVR